MCLYMCVYDYAYMCNYHHQSACIHCRLKIFMMLTFFFQFVLLLPSFLKQFFNLISHPGNYGALYFAFFLYTILLRWWFTYRQIIFLHDLLIFTFCVDFSYDINYFCFFMQSLIFFLSFLIILSNDLLISVFVNLVFSSCFAVIYHYLNQNSWW